MNEKDNEKAVHKQQSKEHYAKLLERLKRDVMDEQQRERLEEVEEEGDGEARITYNK